MKSTGRRLTALIAPLVLSIPVVVATSPPGGAAAVVTGRSACPAAVAERTVHAGMRATGWTTSHGTAPRPFAVKVLGVLHGGIAPGIDLILIRADSRAIRIAGGTWEGMSGSPIYTRDGRLLGALSYGLQFGPSHTAGVTPASAMYKLLRMPRAAAARRFAAHVALRPALRATLVRNGAATAAQAAGGLTPLPTPVAVSGVPADRLPTIASFLRRSGVTGFRLQSGGGVAASAVARPGRMRPGVPFGVALSTGDVTVAAAGTVTAVCGRRVLAFGHPFNFTGPSGASAQRVRVLYVQRENLGAPFIQFNVGGRVGIIDQDRLVGVEGRLGAVPPHPTKIVTTVSASTGLRRHAVTETTMVDQAPGATANAFFSELMATIQKSGNGVVALSWTARGHRANGSPWRVHRSDRIASQFDAEFNAANSLFIMLSPIAANPFTAVTIDRVDIHAVAQDAFAERTLTGLRVFRNGAWRPVDERSTVRVRPGGLIRLRAHLTAYRHTSPDRVVSLALRVSSRTSPGPGSVQVSGGEDLAGSFDPGAAHSFAGLLNRVRSAPANNSLVAHLSVPDATGNSTIESGTRVPLGQATTGTIGFAVEVVGGTG